MSTAFVDVVWGDRRVSIEHQWLDGPAEGPLMVFLHEGLGSVSMWRDFPPQLCNALGCRGLIYSRPGYGRSSPRPADEHWGPDFMHRQAGEVLPRLLQALDVSEPIWLLGHSDGGSIALLYAAQQALAGQGSPPPGPTLAGLIVMAPHILVEDISLRSIAQIRIRLFGAGTRPGWPRPLHSGRSKLNWAASQRLFWRYRA